ncbi:hypothetical protein CIB93_03995 [Streptomyces sp. WZ.A104]|uniref:Uncharacterized protein n=1 Tax=Streptomyces durocortorensis TaxID=2811104 RepID=A0ABY9W4R2_9ACTN|nr:MULTISPECIES: hypothetical protein [Streptomyces]PCG87325.1 hypothetical protein CIB93_03995 [Streptomyces sp. WZ.A104]WNF30988.1 hypothetical protein RI138_31410 [Streptomyces durocortorensis]
MDTEDSTGFEPATGDGPPSGESAERRAASVRTALQGLLQIRRLTGTGEADPEAVPALWERKRPVRAVALALESSGAAPSGVDASGRRVAAGYRVLEGESAGSVRVEWAGPPRSGAVHDEEEALAGCAAALRRLGWTVLLYRGPRRRRYLEVEPPGGLSGGRGEA